MAMAHLAKNSGRLNKNKKAISIREISNLEGLPFEFLSKIFAKLEKAKLVKAKYGANGGYVLAKSPQKISVGDIVFLLENTNAANCQFCNKSKKCTAKNVWNKLDLAINRTLKNINLKELV